MIKSSKQTLAVRRKAAKVAWATLNDKSAFDALTAAQRAELLRKALVFVIKHILGDELPEA